MRAFVRLRHMILDHVELKRELDELRKQTDERFEIVFMIIDKLITALHTASTHMCVEANEHVLWLYISFVDSVPHFPELFNFTSFFQPFKQVICLRQAQAAEI